MVDASPTLMVADAKNKEECMCPLRNIALESVTDRRIDRQTDDGQSYPYVSLCFAGDTKIV